MLRPFRYSINALFGSLLALCLLQFPGAPRDEIDHGKAITSSPERIGDSMIVTLPYN